jgi:hypothetical protein
MSDTFKRICGNCVWLDKEGEEGTTCRQEGQTPESEVCTEFKRKRMNFDDFQQLPEIKKLLSRVSDPVFDIDKSLHDELDKYYIAGGTKKGKIPRRIPKQIHSERDLERVLELFEECQAYRDRVLEILLEHKPLQRELKRAQDLAESCLLSWPSYKELRNERSRRLAMLRITGPIEDRLLQVNSLVERCEMLISNLDHTHFTLKEIREIGVVYLNRRDPMKMASAVARQAG